MEAECRFDSNVFGTAVALHALRDIRDHRAATVRRKGVEFLLRWREPTGLWRFWTSKSGKAIDPDLDVIAVVAAALRGERPDINMATLHTLFRTQQDRHGVFLTWVRDSEAPNDVDAVVNANVLWFMGSQPGLDAAREFVIESLRKPVGAEAHPYYDNVTSLAFAAARAVGGGGLPEGEIRSLVVRGLSDYWSDEAAPRRAIDVASSLAALCALGVRVGELPNYLAAHLLSTQHECGSWPSGPMWNGPEWPRPRSLWWGSECLSTAVAVGALHRMEIAK